MEIKKRDESQGKWWLALFSSEMIFFFQRVLLSVQNNFFWCLLQKKNLVRVFLGFVFLFSFFSWVSRESCCYFATKYFFPSLFDFYLLSLKITISAMPRCVCWYVFMEQWINSLFSNRVIYIFSREKTTTTKKNSNFFQNRRTVFYLGAARRFSMRMSSSEILMCSTPPLTKKIFVNCFSAKKKSRLLLNSCLLTYLNIFFPCFSSSGSLALPWQEEE